MLIPILLIYIAGIVAAFTFIKLYNLTYTVHIPYTEMFKSWYFVLVSMRKLF